MEEVKGVRERERTVEMEDHPGLLPFVVASSRPLLVAGLVVSSVIDVDYGGQWPAKSVGWLARSVAMS